jgi:hypothetical protein
MRRTVLATALVLILAVTLLIAGSTIRFRVASASEPSDLYMTALASGVLHGSVNFDGTACFWLGEDGGRTALYWPYGYTAGGWPLGIYDENGNRLAQVGDTISVGGGLIPESVDSITGCSGFTEYWAAGPRPVRD